MGQAEMLGRFLNIPVRYVAVKDRADLLGALLEGRGDLVVAQLTRTPSRAARVLRDLSRA